MALGRGEGQLTGCLGRRVKLAFPTNITAHAEKNTARADALRFLPLFLLIALVATPLIEIAVFIKVGGWLGLWPTLALVILTAVAGTWVLRRQGFETLRRARLALDRGEVPVNEVIDGVCLLLAGVLLLTPGFVTDAGGAALLVPQVRRALQRHVVARILRRARARQGQRQAPGRGRVIEGEYEEIRSEAEEDLPPPRRGWGEG